MNPLVPIVPFNESPLLITYLGTGLTGVAIGPARSDRALVTVGFGENDAGGAFSALTYNGVAATMLYGPTVSDSFGMGWAMVASGTTVDIAPTQLGGQVWHTWMITGLKTGLHGSQSGSSSGTTLGITTGTPAQKSAFIMGARSRSSSGSFTSNGSGGILAGSPTLDAGANFSGGSNPSLWAISGYGDKSGSNITVNANGSSSFDSGIGFLAVFK